MSKFFVFLVFSYLFLFFTLFVFTNCFPPVYQTLILEIECTRREEKRKALYKRIESEYREYLAKHRALSNILSKDSQFQSLQDELKQKDDVLKQKDNELVRVIVRCSKLEGTLGAKEDELEVSKWVVAEYVQL